MPKVKVLWSYLSRKKGRFFGPTFLERKIGNYHNLAAAATAVAVGVGETVTGAAEDKEKGNDNKPDPLVVENIAKTVIHNKSSVYNV